jgi:ACGX-repeat protein
LKPQKAKTLFKTLNLKEELVMALSNLNGWVNEEAQVATAACGAGDAKPEEKPAACGSACGAGDAKPEEKPAACGSACGAGDNK